MNIDQMFPKILGRAKGGTAVRTRLIHRWILVHGRHMLLEIVEVADNFGTVGALSWDLPRRNTPPTTPTRRRRGYRLVIHVARAQLRLGWFIVMRHAGNAARGEPRCWGGGNVKWGVVWMCKWWGGAPQRPPRPGKPTTCNIQTYHVTPPHMATTRAVKFGSILFFGFQISFR